MISQLSKGRGATIANEVSYCNETLSSGRVTVCRPMRDFLQKEIALYTYLNKLDIITQPSLAELQSVKHRAPFFGSTDLIVEGFFKKLQAGYNVNTVPTVMRLTSKLSQPQNQPVCPLCLGVKDELKSLLEIGSPITGITRTSSKGEVEVERVKSTKELFRSEFERAVCFGCQRLLIESRE